MGKITRILRVYGPEHRDISFAVVEIDSDYANSLLRLMEVFAENYQTYPSLNSMEYWEGSVDWFEWDDLFENKFGDSAEQSEYVDIDRSQTPLPECARTECELLVVDNRGVYWTAMPKHSDITVETVKIYKDDLEEIAIKES